jgi:hypothetical protein
MACFCLSIKQARPTKRRSPARMTGRTGAGQIILYGKEEYKWRHPEHD